ncbi:MAG: aspartate/glutamate racemase family protein [Geminicoccaceae bacterium]|nr:aspartate/glutamate racemase family protein [Geminicoccaceae bacterium]
MRILVVNPNSTVSMTAKIGTAARRVARSGTEIVAVNPKDAPASIQGFHDIAMCLPALLGELRGHGRCDAVVIACFDDTGLDAARCAVDVPVIGIGEAAFHAASFISCRFSVVTTLRRSVPSIEANLVRYGLAARCGRVRASDIPVLALEEAGPDMMERLGREIEMAIDEDQAEAIVLGCAGMADMAAGLAERYGLPVVEGVSSAVLMAEAMAASGLKTSRIGGYAAAN